MARREVYDPLRSFVVNKAFSWGGKHLGAGEPFNDRRDMRRFKQLYDGRYTRMSEVDDGHPMFRGMTDDQLREWLIGRGMVGLAHPRSPRQRLIERCQRAYLASLQQSEQPASAALTFDAIGDGKSQGRLTGVRNAGNVDLVATEAPNDGVAARELHQEDSSSVVQRPPPARPDPPPGQIRRERIR